MGRGQPTRSLRASRSISFVQRVGPGAEPGFREGEIVVGALGEAVEIPPRRVGAPHDNQPNPLALTERQRLGRAEHATLEISFYRRHFEHCSTVCRRVTKDPAEVGSPRRAGLALGVRNIRAPLLQEPHKLDYLRGLTGA